MREERIERNSYVRFEFIEAKNVLQMLVYESICLRVCLIEDSFCFFALERMYWRGSLIEIAEEVRSSFVARERRSLCMNRILFVCLREERIRLLA